MKTNRSRRGGAALVIVLLALLAPAVPAGASQFPASHALEGEQLGLKGTGAAYYARIIHVYDAALYGPAGFRARELLEADVAKCLQIRYRIDLEREKFVLAAEKILRRQHEDLSALQTRIERLHAAYRDVNDGDRYALCYTPDAGTELALNGEPLARIEGPDFARVYFGIWLGERPISPPLREALIGADAAGSGS